MLLLKKNIEKDARNEAENEEPMVTDDPIVFKEQIYFNTLECGKDILNRIEATCEQMCMAIPRYKYLSELYRTITYCNYCNGATFLNDNIQYAIHRVIVEEEADAHNITVDTFSQTPITPNTQGKNKNMILTSKKQNNSDALEKTIKGLTINNARYYES